MKLRTALSSAILLFTLLACAGSACPDGWDESESTGTCVIDECRREELFEGLGNSGAFGLLGRQGDALPPTGAGGGWEPNVGASVTATLFNTRDGIDCGRTDLEPVAVATSNENGEWALPLAAGDYCFVFQTGSFFDAGVGGMGESVTITDGEWLAMRTR